MDSYLDSDTGNGTEQQTGADLRSSFLQKISTLDCLKPLPSAALRLMEACQDPDGNIADLVGLIESDPAISIRVLTAANSPLYGHTRLINSIQHAVVVLGFNAVSQLATSLVTMSVFIDDQQPDKHSHGIERFNLFRHSLATATVARHICDHATDVDAAEAYLAAALHDVGKLVFYELAPQEYTKLILDSDSPDPISLEAELFGISHEQLGEMCAENWGLPDKIGIAIGYHHHPQLAPMYHELVQVIEAANHYAYRWGIGIPGDENDQEHQRPTESDKALLGDNADLFRLDEATAESFMEPVRSDFEKIITACDASG